MSDNSRFDLLKFVDGLAPSIYPVIFMSDDGLLAAEWWHQDGRQISLFFLGEQQVEYVLFLERRSDGIRDVEYGTTSFEDTYGIVNRSIFKGMISPTKTPKE